MDFTLYPSFACALPHPPLLNQLAQALAVWIPGSGKHVHLWHLHVQKTASLGSFLQLFGRH